MFGRPRTSAGLDAPPESTPASSVHRRATAAAVEQHRGGGMERVAVHPTNPHQRRGSIVSAKASADSPTASLDAVAASHTETTRREVLY
ncbi:hypothetical protein CGMCC3_g5365 [Colletotrichum fructicola]|nr:uncharacterized protein CGMCC3_g5365 [Colletotrichum fructicola]KAE9578429.1 hypothetical protein CGMCC3_g5365 [Colletotrichum fructicola]